MLLCKECRRFFGAGDLKSLHRKNIHFIPFRPRKAAEGKGEDTCGFCSFITKNLIEYSSKVLEDDALETLEDVRLCNAGTLVGSLQLPSPQYIFSAYSSLLVSNFTLIKSSGNLIVSLLDRYVEPG